ncbi:MAG: OmpA family protein, partial [Mangrovibacterium sp.]
EMDRMQDDDDLFETKSFGFNLQGVMNMGRMMKWESWTRTFNLLGHGGAGFAKMDYDVNGVDDDWYGSLIGGLTLQARLSPRVSLYADGTAKGNYRQNYAFDGAPGNSNRPVFFRGTVGISVALGGHAEHADWYLSDVSLSDAFGTRVGAVESELNDVQQAGRQQAGKVDELSRKIDDLDRRLAGVPSSVKADPEEMIEKLINDGYVNLFFDFNSTRMNDPVSTINVLRTYLNANPDVTVELRGYADERGTEAYNRQLSKKRADAVARALINAGVEASRLDAVGMGEDISIDSDAAEAYQLARRVSFVIRK